MLVIAVGMPRAGSGWHYNLTHDLIRTIGAADARAIRKRYRLNRILTEVNCNIGVLSFRRLGLVMVPVLFGNTFAVKLHAGPTRLAKTLIPRGWLRPTYIYRDPRDALLSAYEYGLRGRAAGRPNAFSHLKTLDQAIEFMAEYVGYWEAWTQVEGCHRLRYEDLRGNYEAEAERLARHLGVDPDHPEAATVIQRYRPEQASSDQRGLHFVKGVSGRYREALTPQQQATCLASFGDRLSRMGYET